MLVVMIENDTLTHKCKLHPHTATTMFLVITMRTASINEKSALDATGRFWRTKLFFKVSPLYHGGSPMKRRKRKMIENAMAMHNGYGISDTQEYEPVPVEDDCGVEILQGDDILIGPDGSVVLKENALEYLTDVLGFMVRKAGE